MFCVENLPFSKLNVNKLMKYQVMNRWKGKKLRGNLVDFLEAVVVSAYGILTYLVGCEEQM